jgi:hypothetical protein
MKIDTQKKLNDIFKEVYSKHIDDILDKDILSGYSGDLFKDIPPAVNWGGYFNIFGIWDNDKHSIPRKRFK